MDSSASLQRWQQAFEDHPISTTRTIEKQLRAGVANSRERLRGLVGYVVLLQRSPLPLTDNQLQWQLS